MSCIYYTHKLIVIKHGSFGGPGLVTDDLYAAGSDDFRGYVWKIPPISMLEEQRKVFSVNEWENHQPALAEAGELLNFSLVSRHTLLVRILMVFCS